MSITAEQDVDLRITDVIEPTRYRRSELNCLSDEDLIHLFQQDVSMAYEIIVQRYKNPLMNYICRYMGNQDDALDVLQNTFIRLYQKKHRYNLKPPAKFSSWLYSVATNLCKTELRKKQKRPLVSLFSGKRADEQEIAVPSLDPLPDHAADNGFRARIVQDALLRIPEGNREVVILRDIQNLPYEDIAEITSQSVGTVKSRIFRGRMQLQQLLKHLYE